MPEAPGSPARPLEPSAFRRLSEVSWRILVVFALLGLVVWLLAQIPIVVLAVFVAALAASALIPPARWLERHGLPPLAATWIVFAGLLTVLSGLVAAVVPAVVGFSDLGPTLSKAVDDAEGWLVDGPLNLNQAEIDRYRQEAAQRLGEFLRSSAGGILRGAMLVVEVAAGFVLALALAFFIVKDGRRFQDWAADRVPSRHRPLVKAAASRAWGALGGYLRGAVLIGVIEGAAIGAALVVVGADVVVPVVTLTFMAAFFPVVGAVVAGVVAVLVALVTAGTGPALAVAVVAVLVQQLDTDLLAPIIYGRALQLHPAVVLVALTAGGSVAGIMGALLAVPVTAMVFAAAGEIDRRREQGVLGAGAPGR